MERHKGKFCLLLLLLVHAALAQEPTPTAAPSPGVAVKQYLDARQDPKKEKKAFADWVSSLPNPTPGLTAAIDALQADPAFNTPAARFGAGAIEALLTEVASRRERGSPAHELIPLFTKIGAPDDNTDPRVVLAHLEAWGTQSDVFDRETAQKTAGVLDAAMTKAGSNDQAEGAFRKHIPLLSTFPETGAAVDWFASFVSEWSAKADKDPLPPLVPAMRRALRTKVRNDYQEAVKVADNKAQQQHLDWLTRLEPSNPAPWLVQAMTLASWRSVSSAKGARASVGTSLDMFEKLSKGDPKATALALDELGYAKIANGLKPQEVVSILRAPPSGPKEAGIPPPWRADKAWYPDEDYVRTELAKEDKERQRLTDIRDKAKGPVDRINADLEDLRRRIVGTSGSKRQGIQNSIDDKLAELGRFTPALDKAERHLVEFEERYKALRSLTPARPSFELPPLQDG